jgi:hypothetical protein
MSKCAEPERRPAQPGWQACLGSHMGQIPMGRP